MDTERWEHQSLPAMRGQDRPITADVFELQHVTGSKLKWIDNGFAMSGHSIPNGLNHRIEIARPSRVGTDRVIRYVKCPQCRRTLRIEVKSLAARNRTRLLGFLAGMTALTMIVAGFWLMIAVLEPPVGEPSTGRLLLGLNLQGICAALQLIALGGFITAFNHHGAKVLDERDSKGEWIGAKRGRREYHRFID